MILVRSDLEAFTTSNTRVVASTEILWITIPAKSFNAVVGIDLHLAVIYAPPNEQLPETIDHIVQNVSHVYNLHQNDHYLIVGDFNLSNIRWTTQLGPLHIKRGSVELQNAGKHLVEEFNVLGLEQSNFTKNYWDNTLDLVFSNFSASCTRSHISLVTEDRAHPNLSIDTANLTIRPLVERYALNRNFHKCNFADINNYLKEINWVDFFEKCDTVHCAVSCFNSELHRCISTFVPERKVKNNCRSFPSWYNFNLNKILREKWKAHSKWKRFGNESDYIEFSILRARAKSLEHDLYVNYLTYTKSSKSMS